MSTYRDGETSNDRTRRRKERRKRALARALGGFEAKTRRQEQLVFLFKRQKGLCYICGKLATLDGKGGASGSVDSAVRFRLGSSFGKPGRVRPRVMAHRGCAQARSDEIQASVDVDELRHRANAFPTEFYCVPERG